MLTTIVTALVLAAAPIPTRPDPPDPPRADLACSMRRDVMAQVLFARGFSAAAANNFALFTVGDCADRPASPSPLPEGEAEVDVGGLEHRGRADRRTAACRAQAGDAGGQMHVQQVFLGELGRVRGLLELRG